MSIYGNVAGGFGFPKTYIFTDENGNELVAGVVTKQEMVFTANPKEDIRDGKVAATGDGVVTGSTTIPNYETYTGYKLITDGSPFLLRIEDAYDYTKLQAIICKFNTDLENSVGAEQVAIENKVFSVQSTDALSSITINTEDASIDFGITNTSGESRLIRYFLCKEMY